VIESEPPDRKRTTTALPLGCAGRSAAATDRVAATTRDPAALFIVYRMHYLYCRVTGSGKEAGRNEGNDEVRKPTEKYRNDIIF
jgi:hypothetical protein